MNSKDFFGEDDFEGANETLLDFDIPAENSLDTCLADLSYEGAFLK